ncbi:helix-hairpin-helix domain-containing protein [Clostridium omnivorum]|uniref:DNA-binding protein n=1 Tax=Clostridium omnivorum TaxID=1604902 RepID=A0ABQ5NAK4_9CLOT|nr:helix-hairpin-helix domain-containing protein [Clostridium sp. E14]GLC32222.1 DNA-binding protein [Clostridium sp. E14]
MREKKKIIGSIVILIVFFAFLVVGYFISRPKAHNPNENDIFVDSQSVEKQDAKLITVCIEGEVKSPGVYKLETGSIVQELVKKAGGFTENADKNPKLNLARKLKDEDFIYIDKKGETANNSLKSSASNASKVEDKVNINTATLDELDKVSGIGPVTAQKIIDYRDKNGYFNTIEDLKKIGGIGDKTINKFRDKVDIR